MTPEEARDEYAALIDEVQRAVGTEFEVEDDPTPGWCQLPDGGDGVHFHFSRIGPPPADVDEIAGTVRELWEGRGFAVREARIGPAVELATRVEHDAPMVFRASEHAMTLGGTSGCMASPETN